MKGILDSNIHPEKKQFLESITSSLIANDSLANYSNN